MHLSDRIVSTYHRENFLLVSNSFDLGVFKLTSQAEILTITDGHWWSLMAHSFERSRFQHWNGISSSKIIQYHPMNRIQEKERKDEWSLKTILCPLSSPLSSDQRSALLSWRCTPGSLSATAWDFRPISARLYLQQHKQKKRQSKPEGPWRKKRMKHKIRCWQ